MADKAKKKQDKTSGTPVATPVKAAVNKRESGVLRGKAYKKHPKTNKVTGKSIMGYRRDRFLVMAGITKADGQYLVPLYEVEQRIIEFKKELRDKKNAGRGRTKAERERNFKNGPGRQRSAHEAAHNLPPAKKHEPITDNEKNRLNAEHRRAKETAEKIRAANPNKSEADLAVAVRSGSIEVPELEI